MAAPSRGREAGCSSIDRLDDPIMISISL